MFDGAVDLETDTPMPMGQGNTFGTHPQQETNQVEIKIPCLISYAGVVRQAVDALSEMLLLPPDSRAAVKLAVGEACNNAILHTEPTPENTPGTVAVVCRVTPEALEVEITNRGDGFLPGPIAKMPDPETLSEHGRGMALMEMMMDSVEYVSHHGNTTVRMRKNRSLPGTTTV